MRNFQDTFETRKRSFINAFSICMTVPSKYQTKRKNSHRIELKKGDLYKNLSRSSCIHLISHCIDVNENEINYTFLYIRLNLI